MNRLINHSHARGFTLIETVIAMVVIGIGMAAFTLAFRAATLHSVDPLFQQQANAIAQSYLEEVTAKPFCDPNNLSATDCALSCNVSACNATCSATGETRANYDSICDYDQISNESPPVDQTGAAIVALAAYTVNIDIIDSGVTLGPAGNILNANSGEVVKVDVTVTHSSGSSTTLTAYRANY